MKRIPTIAAMLSLALLVSCNSSPKVNFHDVEKDGNFALMEGRTDTLYLSVDAEYPDVENNDAEAAGKIRSAINRTMFGPAYEDLSEDEAIRDWFEQNTKEYRKSSLELLQVMKEDGESTDFSISWEYAKEGKVTETYGNICTYSIVSYYYAGGAHGLSYETTLNFNMESGDMLKTEDVFVKGSEKQISGLLTKHLNDERDEEEQIVLFEDEILPNGNFSIGKKGITFTYDPYEIAAYSFGIIDIFIPAEEILPYLNPELALY